MRRLTILSMSGLALLAQTKPASPPAPPKAIIQPQVAAPRYQALNFGAGTEGYPNFLWVVDTETGFVSAYRVASIKDKGGAHQAWIIEKLMTEFQYYTLSNPPTQGQGTPPAQ